MREWTRRSVALVVCLGLTWLTVGCGQNVTEYDALYLAISSEVTPSPILGLDIALHNTASGPALKLPAKPGDADYAFALPDGLHIVKGVNPPYVLRIKHDQASGAAQQLQLRIRGLDGTKVLAAYSGVIDTRQKGQIAVLLKAIDATCDADGDGTPDCSKAGCCDKAGLSATDCNDDPTLDPNTKLPKGAAASPFGFEDACTQCGDGIDQDCDGSDTACLDSDKDGVPDCLETSCATGAATDPSIHPGAVELCDSKDNDCNGLTDDGLPYVGIDGASAAGKKGDACGVGACAGGSIECAPAGADGKAVSLRCSSAVKKAAMDDCANQDDDDCDGQINNGCALIDIDGDGVENDKEKAACAFVFAQYHAEYHPGAPETRCCLPGQTSAECDLNCDGKTTPCDATDKDGDGSPASVDCDDKDPLRYPGAPEKCGDGTVQGCFGVDPACASVVDKDGDGWSPPADCNDNDKTINPQAKELCNGLDDNCNGIVDDGNPEAIDATCGNQKGECKNKSGIQVCKHFPVGQKPTDPLDCLGKAFAAENGTCVGCDGDQRPTKDIYNDLDEDCDGSSDEDYQYAQQPGGSLLLVGEDCDGVGACGVGKVECNKAIDKAVCSTDANGSTPANKVEVCDNQDNDCNGKTDESLSTVADSTCQKVGVCAQALSAIQTVCVAGQWLCDYAAVPNIEFSAGESCTPGTAGCQCSNLGQSCLKLVETTCDALDNDCDGKTDDDFSFDDLGAARAIGVGCGTGACAGGTVVCAADKVSLTCDSLPKITKEICDAKDNDCDGLTDNGMTVADSDCKLVGVCSTANVQATCPAGKWVCKYDAVANYQAPTETTCDAKDNDCDGLTDEDFAFVDLGQSKAKGQACGTGACKSGLVVCKGDQSDLTCSTLDNLSTELCNGADDDCDSLTDEGFLYSQEGGAQLGIGKSCDGIGMCGGGTVQCATTLIATCSSDPNGSAYSGAPEQCNDLDDNCNSSTDEACDEDKDGYCDAAMTTIGTPKSCPGGGGDCQKSNPAVHPGATELCDGIDNNCNASTDEVFFYKEPGSDVGLGIDTLCGLGACAGGKVVCSQDKLGAYCTTAFKQSAEICNGIDDDCDGQKDEGCDDDKDGYCDIGIDWTSGAAITCAKTTSLDSRDCNDTVATINPGMTEACNGIDDNCKTGTDEGCDDDKDGYCDAGMTTASPVPALCPKGGGDCDDVSAAVHPSATETCNDLDDNCVAGIDEGCDDDGDKYCDVNMTVVGTPKVCTKTLGTPTLDCNDDVGLINPGGTELCDNIDNNCSAAIDEGCDDDKDGYCDAAMIVVGKPAVCPKTLTPAATDCNDQSAAVNPGQTELCNNIDDNCTSGSDEGCDDDKDLYCDAAMVSVGAVTVCPKSAAGVTDDCDDKAKDVHPGATELCDNIDNNCAGSPAIDEGCDDDGDKYCDAVMTIVGTPSICPKTTSAQTKDCNDQSAAINPGATELCSSAGVDDNCNSQTDEAGATGCSTFYKDADQDGFGIGASFCLCGADATNKITAPGGTDCNDGNAAINPGVPKDLCATPGVDDNCNGATDPEDSGGCTSFYLDTDQDGYGVAPAHCLCGASAKITATNATDCLDSNAAVNPGVAKDTCATAGVDDNCDGVTDAATSTACTVYFLDGDGDGYGKLSDSQCTCAAVGNHKISGVTATNADCDDAAAAVHPNVTEICDNIDNNCILGVDEGCDDDNDDYCDLGMAKAAIQVTTCKSTATLALVGDDCDDGSNAVHPGVTEICDNIDNNCAGAPAIDEGCDDDNDNYCDLGMIKAAVLVSTCTATASGATSGDDCDDQKAATRPGVTEICDNIDNNCTLGADEGCDDDDDNYCDGSMTKAAVTVTTCTATAAAAVSGDDCDDGATDVHPGVTEVCDNVDNNCAGSPAIDEGCDDDNDGYCDKNMGKKPGTTVTTCTATGPGGSAGDDCDDSAVSAHPGGTEICDNLDNNCASGTDEGCDDDDDNYCDAGMTKAAGVTVTTCSATAVGASVGDDCDDACTSCMPGGKETCDNKDNDCSGVVDDHMTLIDSSCLHLGQCGAGVLFACVSASQTWTCDYSGVAAYEATEETTCDGLDNDCDGATDFEFSYLDGAVSKHIGAVCGLGICADQVVCNGAKSAAVCPKASLAVPENCANNLDDDCDGVVNNGCP